jgi:hypothetical protein
MELVHHGEDVQMLGKAGEADDCFGHWVLAAASKAADARMCAGRGKQRPPREV